MADRLGRLVVEFRKERSGFPVIVAAPTNGMASVCFTFCAVQMVHIMLQVSSRMNLSLTQIRAKSLNLRSISIRRDALNLPAQTEKNSLVFCHINIAVTFYYV